MIALPFTHLALKTPKPRNPAYPESINALSGHIRKRRLDLGMHQKDVAESVNATTSVVANREKNRPTLRNISCTKIIKILGDDLLQSNATSFGEKIKQCRIQNELILRKLSKELY